MHQGRGGGGCRGEGGTETKGILQEGHEEIEGRIWHFATATNLDYVLRMFVVCIFHSTSFSEAKISQQKLSSTTIIDNR